MKHKGVLTVYFNKGREYTSYILASTIQEAKRLRRERNIGEKIVSEVRNIEILHDYREESNEEFVQLLPEIMQQAAFLSYVSFAAGKIKLEDALGKSSLLDQLMRLPSVGIVTEIIEAVRRDLYSFQQLAPGVFDFKEVRAEKEITVKVAANGRKTIRHIVNGSFAANLGPAAITICDCADPDCGITDDDQPCGYEQTIEANAKAQINTSSNFIHLVNKDAKQAATVQLVVMEKNK